MLKEIKGEFWIGDLCVGENRATSRQMKNGTFLFFEKVSQLNFLITNSKPTAYFRVRHKNSRGLWQIRRREETQNGLWPYVYLYWRWARRDEDFKKRRNLFTRTDEIVVNPDPTSEDQIEYQVNELMRKLYGN